MRLESDDGCQDQSLNRILHVQMMALTAALEERDVK